MNAFNRTRFISCFEFSRAFMTARFQNKFKSTLALVTNEALEKPENCMKNGQFRWGQGRFKGCQRHA